MLNTIEYSLPEELDAAVRHEAQNWTEGQKVSRIWDRDAAVWTGDDEGQWLGWLDIIESELADTGKYDSFAADVAAAGFRQVLLMGMGGSSLCPEVLSITFGKQQFQILDSTDPAQIRRVEESIDLEKTLFIVASKSGSTLEPNCFKQYFFEKVAEKAGREKAGQQFVAITDPGSKMEQVARNDGFRHIFFGKPEIGGRFSALSAFGLTAAAAMGLNVESLLRNALEMSQACRTDEVQTNPGALLGTILGISQRSGRDKLTIFASPEIYDLGAWLEQLIAESTGKEGIAIIPIDREPATADQAYSRDRVSVFVFLSVTGGEARDDVYNRLAADGHPVIKIGLPSVDNLGQEFFRWEFATAVAGSTMRINPFNQPDVEAAKIEARKLTDQYEQTGSLPDETPFFDDGEVSLFTGENYARELSSSGGDSLEGIIRAHLATTMSGDYFGVLAYIEMNAEHERVLTELRSRVLARTGVATCLGFGPRFLHSTGQAYKGGGNNGVFLQITAGDADDLPVPGQKYTFGVVKAAQARGDFQVLVDRERRALRVHLRSDIAGGLARLTQMI